MNTSNFDQRIFIPPEETKLTQEQKDLVVGTLLGDANLQTHSKTGKAWRYRVLHAGSQYLYLEHKYEILKDFCGTPPKKSKVPDKRTNKVYDRCLFNTKSNIYFTPYAKAFYMYDSNAQKYIKDVPENIDEILTPRAVAYWYMDDGWIKWVGKSNAMRLCTESFSIEGIEILRDAMKKNFNLSLNKHRKPLSNNKIGYRLYINEKNSAPFREIIRPYLVDCMKYKVSDGNKGTLG